MEKHGVAVDVVRAVDHDIATGVWPDMREHGWATDDWPAIFEKVLASDILVLAGPIWLGDNSSVMKQVHERLYGGSHLLNDAGQYLYYGRVGGCLITGNEDGVKHCAQNVLYTLQHIGYTIPPQADAGWIGEAGPGPSYLDPGSGGPENDFTNRNTTFMTWNLMHLARMLARRRRRSGIRQYPIGMGCGMSLRLRQSGIPVSGYIVTVMTETATTNRRSSPRCATVTRPRSPQLVDQHTPSMLRVARGYVPSREIAEEVVQETWIALVKGIDEFEGRSSLRTWLFA